MSQQSTQKWDLEERMEEPIVRTPIHANPIRSRFGDYEVRTWDIVEGFGSNYHLRGQLSVSKIGTRTDKKKKYLVFGPEVPVETETVEWKSVVPANSFDHQLYHPRALAETVVTDLRSQGVGVNPQRTEELLVEALKPYVNRALHFCVDTKKYAILGEHVEKCKLRG